MAEIKRNFLQGKMNIDLDDRLVQSGSYRTAENVSVSRSGNADVGALENVLGNRQINVPFPITSSTVCVGSVTDELNNKVYWFIVSPTREGIFEYDLENDEINRVLEFTRDKRVFRFDTNFVITGANVIGNLLYWTDGLNPPRKINISRFVSRRESIITNPGVVQNVIVGSGRYYSRNNQRQYHATDVRNIEVLQFGNAGNPDTIAGQTNFSILDLPPTAQDLQVDSVMVNEEDAAFTISGTVITLTSGLENNNDFVRIAYNYIEQRASELSVPGDDQAQLVSSFNPEYDNSGVALVNLDTDQIDSTRLDASFSQQPAFHGDLINVAKRPPLFPPQISNISRLVNAPSTQIEQTFTVGSLLFQFAGLSNVIDPDDPGISLTVNGIATPIVEASLEPTTGWQWSSVIGFGNFIINLDEDLVLNDTFTVTYNGTQSFDAIETPSQPGEYVHDNFVYFAYRYKYRDGEVTALSPFSGPAFFPTSFSSDRETGAITSMVNQLSTINVAYDVGDLEVTEIELVVTSSLDVTLKSLTTINKAEQGLISSTPYKRNIQIFTYDNNKVYSTIPSRELLRIYDDVPLTAKAQEIVGNRLVYGNYVQNYNLSKNNTLGDIIVPNFTIGYDSATSTASTLTPSCSVKTDRDYQVGIVYLDREGRQTPVLLADGVGGNSTVNIPFNDVEQPGITHTNRNTLNVTISSPAPYWATHYRFFIKQVQGAYYNVLPKNAIRNGDKVYLRLAGDDRNKVTPETELVLKGNVNGVRDIRSLWRIDPYVQDGDNSRFSVTTNEDGGFDISSNADDLISFNIPFEEANRRVNYEFAERLINDGTEEIDYVSLQFAYNLAIGTNDDDISDIVITSITLEDGTVLVEGTDYGSTNGNFAIYGLTDRGLMTVEYTYTTSDFESEARDDFYVAITPSKSSDLPFIADASGDVVTIFETVPRLESVTDIYYEHGETFRCVNGAHTTASEEIVTVSDQVQSVYRVGDTIPTGKSVGDAEEGSVVTVYLNKYFNCFSYPTGIEETTIEGKFNGTVLRPGIKASTVNEAYRRREQLNWLIHSGVFNDDVNLNRLNQFPVGESITDELDIGDGSIQKLHSRDTNLIVFQEDKIKNVPIQKNLIQTAGNSIVLTRDSQFFGTDSSYTGEYGISQNPESFSTYGSNIYFADKNRGALCKLSANGIQEISQNGVESYVRDIIKDSDLIIGHYDYFYDQAHFSFRNRVQELGFSPDREPILLSEDGRPGPRSECNRDDELVTFKQFFIYQSNQPDTSVGDAVYLDSEGLTQFNGNYRWFKVQDVAGTMVGGEENRYNRAIQISPFGVVTGLEGNCIANQPRDLPRDVFNISSESFTSPEDACANGVIDSLIYHNGRTNEPIVGNIVYEGRWDDIQSSRTGWYIISVIEDKSVIYMCNGVVESVISCDAISANRRAILGSNPQNILSTQQSFILDEICTEPFAEQVYWYDSDGDLPIEGDILYANNHDDTLALGDRYYAFPNGFYARIDSDSRIETGFPASCSEKVCFTNPTELLTQSTTNPFEFTFNGVERTYSFTTTGSVIDVISSRAISNVEIEYTVQGENKYPSTGVFRINAQNPDGTVYYDSRISDENREEILDGAQVTPLNLGSFGAGSFQPETITLLPPNVDAGLSTQTFPDYTRDAVVNEDRIQVNITRLCYRLGNATGTSIAWVTPVGASGLTCGMSTAMDPVYYNAEAPERRYFETQALEEAAAWDKGAGTFGVSHVDPIQAEGGGVVSEIATISTNGTVNSEFRCVGANPTYVILLGMAEPGADTAQQQTACNLAEINSANQVTVYSDQPRTNFRDDDTEDPPTRFANADGSNAEPGLYTDGVAIRNVVNGVVGPQLNQGCGFALTAQLDVTSGVTGGTPSIILRTNQGTEATYAGGTEAVTLEDTGDIGDDWNFTVTIAPPTGMEFEGTGPFISIDSGNTVAVASTGITSWNGTFLITHQDPGPEPMQTMHFTGVLAAPDPEDPIEDYTATLVANESISGASVSFSNTSGVHSFAASGNSYSATVPLDGTGTVSASIGLDSGRQWLTGPFVNNANTGSSSFSHAYSMGTPRRIVTFSGTTSAIPVTRGFSLTGTTDNGNTTASNDSLTLSTGGSGILTSTLSASSGWLLVSHTPGSTTQSVDVSYGSTRTYTRNWTSVVANRHSHSVTEVSTWSGSGTCPTGGSAATIYTDNATIYNGIIYTGITSTTRDTSTRYFISGTTVYTWTGSSGSFSSATCTNPPPADWSGVDFSTGSSAEGACDNASGTLELFQNPDNAAQFSTTASGTGTASVNRRLFYAIGNRNYSFSTTGVRTDDGLCYGVYVGGTRIAAGIDHSLASFTSTGTRTGSVQVVGDIDAVFSTAGGLSPSGSPNVARSWSITGTVEEQNTQNMELTMVSTGSFSSGQALSGNNPLTFTPATRTVGEGTYDYELDITITNLFGGATLRVTY